MMFFEGFRVPSTYVNLLYTCKRKKTIALLPFEKALLARVTVRNISRRMLMVGLATDVCVSVYGFNFRSNEGTTHYYLLRDKRSPQPEARR